MPSVMLWPICGGNGCNQEQSVYKQRKASVHCFMGLIGQAKRNARILGGDQQRGFRG